jgi:hypothetical protein
MTFERVNPAVASNRSNEFESIVVAQSRGFAFVSSQQEVQPEAPYRSKSPMKS